MASIEHRLLVGTCVCADLQQHAVYDGELAVLMLTREMGFQTRNNDVPCRMHVALSHVRYTCPLWSA